jgi:hypothetical protein
MIRALVLERDQMTTNPLSEGRKHPFIKGTKISAHMTMAIVCGTFADVQGQIRAIT